MLEDFIWRENAVFDMLHKFQDADLDFVVVGGFAVAAFKHRFSVDADILIRREDITKFEEILEKNGFFIVISKQLENIYSSEFKRYQTRGNLPVSVDLMIDAVAARQTEAVFGFDLLKSHAKKRKIVGSEKEIVAIVPDKEMLITLKLHSGRLTDFRDAVALFEDVDINLIKQVINRGKPAVLKQHIEKLLSLLSERAFIDSFKGVFAEKKYVDTEKVRKGLARLI